ncbi:urease accessory protein UreE [Taklimakanibacter deserti]|uniref:urease accessory protein UreE n=1 Tax=Taklimakanibacter deserti TaxID=2267839 RepID=UPI000E65035A
MRAQSIKPKGTWSGTPADRVTLDYEDRCRRRIAMIGEGGLSFLLDLAATTYLKDGDALLLDDGRLVEIKAEAENLLEIKGRDRLHLMTLAWHLGNRHLAAQIEPERIVIRHDPVIAHMLEHQGARLRKVREPFNPEGGAYSAHHGHEH